MGIPTSHFRLVGVRTSTAGVGSTAVTGIITHLK